MDKRFKAQTSQPIANKENLNDDSINDDEMNEEEEDKVKDVNITQQKKKISIIAYKQSNEDLTTISETPSALASDNKNSEQSDFPEKKGSRLRKKGIGAKRGSMTDIDFYNRRNTIQEIKDSTRKIVAFTLKNLDKAKPIQHFKNENLVFEDKDKEFQYYYDIKDSLGEGCSSFVKRCICKNTKEVYAVKIFRAYDDEYVNFAKNEFNNMKNIMNDNVAKVYEMFYDQNCQKIYTIMEFCPGVTLMKLIRDNGPINEKASKYIMLKILQGVVAMHESGTVHRIPKEDMDKMKSVSSVFSYDKKKSISKMSISALNNNDFHTNNKDKVDKDLLNNMKIKIIDFNVSRSKSSKINFIFDRESKKNVIMYSIAGTPYFSAPELLACMTCYTEQVDIWAVGCLLYYITQGVLPFKGNNAKEVLEAQQKKPIDFTKKEFFNFSYDYKSFLSSLLNLDWGERLSGSQAILHPWLKSIAPSSLVTFKKLTYQELSRTKTNQNLPSKLNIELLNCLVSVARGTDRKLIRRRPHSVNNKTFILRVSKTK